MLSESREAARAKNGMPGRLLDRRSIDQIR